MEKLMLGEDIKNEMKARAKSSLCELFAIVRKGHEECGDSAFIYSDDNQAIAAVFDGVSGEAGAASASSEAARTIINYLKHKKLTENSLKEAILEAQNRIKNGYTTAAIAWIDKKGSFILVGIGDSPMYGMTVNGEIGIELPLGRAVKDKDSLMKFLYCRNLVTSVLGSKESSLELHVKKGKIKKGEMLILASDGLNDNLFIITDKGYVKDSSGVSDLKELIGKLSRPEDIVKKLMKEIKSRISKGKIEKKNKILVPKKDDIAIIALKWL
jgi:serine/threonine protein phosphatase PrpC